jgi:hypothetical protein
LPDDLWIAGAELLPLQSIADETQRERRSSIVHLEQNKRFEADVARAYSRSSSVVQGSVLADALSTSPMPSAISNSRHASTSDLASSFQPTRSMIKRSDSNVSIGDQSSPNVNAQLLGLSIKSKSQAKLSGIPETKPSVKPAVRTVGFNPE